MPAANGIIMNETCYVPAVASSYKYFVLKSRQLMLIKSQGADEAHYII